MYMKIYQKESCRYIKYDFFFIKFISLITFTYFKILKYNIKSVIIYISKFIICKSELVINFFNHFV